MDPISIGPVYDPESELTYFESALQFCIRRYLYNICTTQESNGCEDVTDNHVRNLGFVVYPLFLCAYP
jgi:hypothetical protein